ncbi:MAG: hypothetical protein HYZ28_29050 [Myxococcales bacterium]|nr:hypothetical protein [Myxococcales bacterium]
MSEHPASKLAFEVIQRALASAAKTREPMNALVVWTELGKGLSGTLDGVGAEPGLLRRVISEWCQGRGATERADLSRWAYRLEGKERLGKLEAAMAMRRVQADLEAALPELSAEAAMGDEGRKKLFLAVVRGWFPVGLEVLRDFPAGRVAKEEELLSALWAWCRRYLPAGGAGAAELGVRVER